MSEKLSKKEKVGPGEKVTIELLPNASSEELKGLPGANEKVANGNLQEKQNSKKCRFCREILICSLVVISTLITLIVINDMISGKKASHVTGIANKTNIAKLRERQLQLCREDPDSYDADDIEFISKNDILLRMTLREKQDPDEAAEHFDELMRWRKEVGVAKITAADIPCEAFALNGSVLAFDLQGDPVLWYRAKFARDNIGPLKLLDDKARLWWHEALLKEGFERVTVMTDFTDASIRYFDKNKVLFFIKIIKYYPGQVQGIILNAPWYLQSLVFLIKGLLSSVLEARVMDLEELPGFIDNKHLPKYLGGDNPANFSAWVDGCYSWRERLPEYLTKEDMETFERDRSDFDDY